MNPQCARCGSSRIIPGVKVADRDGGTDHNQHLVFYQDPAALLFKGRVYCELKADVCGHCGHVELYIVNPEQLYDAYLNAQAQGKAPETETEVEDWDDLGWQCPKCGKRVSDDLEVCWNCGTAADGTEDPDFRRG